MNNPELEKMKAEEMLMVAKNENLSVSAEGNFFSHIFSQLI